MPSLCIILSSIVLSVLLPSIAFTKSFPSISATDLNGQEYQVPKDLSGEPRVLIMAFEREHQDIVDPWLEALERLQQTQYENMRYYELPTVEGDSWLFKTFLDEAMKSGIDTREARARTITLFLNGREPFMQQLDIKDMSIIYVMVLNNVHEIVTRVNGEFSPEKLTKIEKAF